MDHEPSKGSGGIIAAIVGIVGAVSGAIGAFSGAMKFLATATARMNAQDEKIGRLEEQNEKQAQGMLDQDKKIELLEKEIESLRRQINLKDGLLAQKEAQITALNAELKEVRHQRNNAHGREILYKTMLVDHNLWDEKLEPGPAPSSDDVTKEAQPPESLD